MLAILGKHAGLVCGVQVRGGGVHISTINEAIAAGLSAQVLKEVLQTSIVRLLMTLFQL